jgi:membrane protein EpsK
MSGNGELLTAVAPATEVSTPQVATGMAPRRGRFVVNVSTNIANFLIGGLVSLWFTPFLIRNLGIGAYGVVPLAITVTSYLSIITLALNSAVGRFITVCAERGRKDEVEKFFNTSLFGSLILALLLLPGLVWVALNASHVLRVPPGHERDAQWLMGLTFLAFFVVEIGSAFDVATFCRNRFDLRNLSSISGQVIRVTAVVSLFALGAPKVWHIGAGIFSAALVSLMLSILWWKQLMPGVKVRLRSFSAHMLRQLVGTGGWVLVNQVGTILLVSIDLIVVNRLFGAEQSGKYASVMQWSVMLRQLGLVMAGVFAPSIMAAFARGETEELILYTRRAVKFLGLVIALPVGLLCGFSRPLLSLWLGNDFAHLGALMSVMIFPLALNVGYLPLSHVYMATNNMKWPAIVQIIVGVLNLVFALLMAGPLKMGVYGIALSGVLSLTLRNLIFTPLYASYVLHRPAPTFMREALPIVAASALLACLALFLSASISNWLQLCAVGAVFSLAYTAAAWNCVLNREERLLAVSKLPLGMWKRRHALWQT